MAFTTSEHLPAAEAALRHARCRALLARLCPQASGLLAFARTSVYYLTGTLGNGMVWLPQQGEPVLLVRKGAERCCLESPLQHISTFKSYSEIPQLCAAVGAPLGTVVAAEKSALPWSLAQMMQSRLKGCAFVDGDAVLAQAQAVKSPWELQKLEKAGALHAQALHELLPARARPGMTERHIAHALWEIFFSLGHAGMLRMGQPGQEIFLGRVSVGDNANYPAPFSGPVGLKGEHPCTPFMGYAGNVWRQGQTLTVDTGFLYEGYHSALGVTFFAGPASSVPESVRRAHACCEEILHSLTSLLTPGRPVAELWQKARDLAAEAGFAEGFLGQGGNNMSPVGQGVGLVMDQWPHVAGNEAVLEERMVLTLEPRIALPGLGLTGVQETFVVTPQGGRCLTGGRTVLHCVE